MKNLIVFILLFAFLSVTGCQAIIIEGTPQPIRVSESELISHFQNACSKATKSFFVPPENDVYILAAQTVCREELFWYFQNNTLKKVWPGPNQIGNEVSAAGAIALEISRKWEKEGWTDNPTGAYLTLMKMFEEERIILEKEMVITPSPNQ